jgi:hypothetical protein
MSGLKQGQKNGKIDTLQQKLISDQIENVKKQKNELQKKMRKQYENNELIFSDVNSFNKDVNFNHPNNIALLNTNNNLSFMTKDFNKLSNNVKKEYNEVSKTVNLSRKNMMDANEIMTLKNRELEHQLDNIEDIENDITTKTRLIELNNQKTIIKNKEIKALTLFFALLLFFVIPYTLYLSKRIKLITLYLIIFVSILIYLFYLFFYLNLGRFEQAFNSEIDSAKKTGNALEKAIINTGQMIEEDLKDFIGLNCKCPEDKEEKTKKPSSVTSNVLKDGFDYYDGSAPFEKIIPWDEKFNDRIQWQAENSINSKPDNFNKLPKGDY